MRRLVQGIERQPPPRVCYAQVEFGLVSVKADQPLQCPCEMAAQLFGLKKLPLVKSRTVTQRKALHKFAAVECHRLRKRRDAARAHLSGPMAVPVTVGDARVKFMNV